MFKSSSIIELLNKTICVNEIVFGDYKSFLKVLFRTSDPVFFEKNILNFLKTCTDLTDEELNDLNCVELIILLIEVRILSIGSVLRVHLEDNNKSNEKKEKEKFKEENPNREDDKDKKKDKKKDEEETKQITTITKNLYKLKEDLLQYNNNNNISFDKLKVTLTAPKLSELSRELPIDHFIRCLELNNKKLLLNKIKTNASDILPATVSDQIKHAIERYFNYFSKFIFITTYKDEEDGKKEENHIYLTLEYDFFVHLIKLLYGDDLLVLHQNCFKLSQFANIDLNYINNIPPGDVFLYMKILDAEIKAQNKLEQNS